MAQWAMRNALFFIPLTLAGLGVAHQATVMEWARTHSALLPVVVVLILLALLVSVLKRFLIITFCYGIAFLSYHTFRVANPLPPGLNYNWILTVRALVLEMVMALAVLAAVTETLKPNTALARRSYFAAIGLYFTGTGLRSYCWFHDLRSLFLLVTGLAALAACLFGHEGEKTDAAENATHPAQLEEIGISLKSRRMREWTDTVDTEEKQPSVKAP